MADLVLKSQQTTPPSTGASPSSVDGLSLPKSSIEEIRYLQEFIRSRIIGHMYKNQLRSQQMAANEVESSELSAKAKLINNLVAFAKEPAEKMAEKFSSREIAELSQAANSLSSAADFRESAQREMEKNKIPASPRLASFKPVLPALKIPKLETVPPPKSQRSNVFEKAEKKRFTEIKPRSKVAEKARTKEKKNLAVPERGNPEIAVEDYRKLARSLLIDARTKLRISQEVEKISEENAKRYREMAKKSWFWKRPRLYSDARKSDAVANENRRGKNVYSKLIISGQRTLEEAEKQRALAIKEKKPEKARRLFNLAINAYEEIAVNFTQENVKGLIEKEMAKEAAKKRR